MTDEPRRAEPGFRVYVEREGDKIDITHAVMDAYDVVVNSMDFGSGFLSTEEVENARHLGNAIGAKPFRYMYDKCLRCGHDSENHHGSEQNCYRSDCSCPGFIDHGINRTENPSTSPGESKP